MISCLRPSLVPIEPKPGGSFRKRKDVFYRSCYCSAFSCFFCLHVLASDFLSFLVSCIRVPFSLRVSVIVLLSFGAVSYCSFFLQSCFPSSSIVFSCPVLSFMMSFCRSVFFLSSLSFLSFVLSSFCAFRYSLNFFSFLSAFLSLTLPFSLSALSLISLALSFLLSFFRSFLLSVCLLSVFLSVCLSVCLLIVLSCFLSICLPFLLLSRLVFSRFLPLFLPIFLWPRASRAHLCVFCPLNLTVYVSLSLSPLSKTGGRVHVPRGDSKTLH